MPTPKLALSGKVADDILERIFQPTTKPSARDQAEETLRPAGDRHADHRRDRAGGAQGLMAQGGQAPLWGTPLAPPIEAQGGQAPLVGNPPRPATLGWLHTRRDMARRSRANPATQ